ncbi:hypothetical protein BMS3Bbin01_01271 [bacterium BMS3Bbin01]|nr:hypothetical protein BMS3Bbin01_01271 [bacterium BMS3Bbin01]
MFEDVGERCTDAGQVVAGTLHGLTRYGNHTLHEGTSSTHGLGNGHRGAHVLADDPDVVGEPSRRDLPAQENLDQDLLGARRIVTRHEAHVDHRAEIRDGHCPFERRGYVFLVRFHREDGTGRVDHTHDPPQTVERLVSVFESHPMVRREIGLTLHHIDDHRVDVDPRRGIELDGGREPGTGQPDDTRATNDSTELVGSCRLQVRDHAEIRPLVLPVVLDHDRGHDTSERVGTLLHCEDPPRDGGMNRRRHSGGALADNVTDPDPIANADGRLARLANVLAKGNYRELRRGQRNDRSRSRRVLVRIEGRDVPAPCEQIHISSLPRRSERTDHRCGRRSSR